MGCPIQKSMDQSLFSAPHGLSQSITSFIASYCQGIHQTPFSRLIWSRNSQTTSVSSPFCKKSRRTKSKCIHCNASRWFSNWHCSSSITTTPVSVLDLEQNRFSRRQWLHAEPQPIWLTSYAKRLYSDVLYLSKRCQCRSHPKMPRRASDWTVKYSTVLNGQIVFCCWWVEEDLNLRPHPYQGCALTNWATDPTSLKP